jgi:2-polyprenyl-3-methyl-5-hydroxy-6-metoxy-1,4-benzoquinol methylase
MPAGAHLVNGVWQLGAVDPKLSALYEAVRSREQRIHADEVVRDLPASGGRTAHPAEWRVRARSLAELLSALRLHGSGLRVLDIGCGNGWMSAALAAEGHSVVALDMHGIELEQAARVFADRDVTWCLGDPRDTVLPSAHFDVVVFAASLQYFRDLPALFERVFPLLRPKASVHVVDTMLYPDRTAADAALERSRAYYATLGAGEMAGHYHAHCLDDLRTLGPMQVLRRPTKPGGLRWPWRERTPFHHVTITAPGPSAV